MGRDLLGAPRVRAADANATSRSRTADRTPPPGDGGSVEEPSWVDRVKDAIPVEIVTAWAAIEAFIGYGSVAPNRYLALIAGMAVVTAVHMWVDVRKPTRDLAERLEVPLAYLRQSQYVQVVLAVVAFLVWAYYLGGLYGRTLPDPLVYEPTVAKVLLPLFVVAGPMLLPAVLRKLHGVDASGGE